MLTVDRRGARASGIRPHEEVVASSESDPAQNTFGGVVVDLDAAVITVARVDRELEWHIAARPTDIARLPEGRKKKAAKKVQHARPACERRWHIPFLVVKRQFGLAKVRFRGLPKNTAHVITLFALLNL